MAGSKTVRKTERKPARNTVRKNAIMVSYPHRLHGTSVFDDKTTGVV